MLVLRPPVLSCLREADAFAWLHGGVEGISGDRGVDDAPVLIGVSFLRHSPFLQTIYSHFSELEARKCKVKLAPSQPAATHAVVPLINEDDHSECFWRGVEDVGGVALDPCRRLSEVEWGLFRHAYMAVSYPILGRPQPPSASQSPTDEVIKSSESADEDGGVSGHGKRPDVPYNEEADSVAAIPEETLIDLLRSVFAMSSESFLLHRQKLYEKIGRKTTCKILAEELCNRLFVLENNRHPFYSPGAFLSRNAYDQWQQRERIHITSLFQLFWYQALPSLRNCVPAKLASKHDEYAKLLNMLMKFEQPLDVRRRDNPYSGGRLVRSCLLSSAAQRMLQEFSLRYGIGETYCRLVYLEHLVGQYGTDLWFLQHLGRCVSLFLDRFPSHSSRAIITKSEYEKCVGIVRSLLGDYLPKTFLKLRLFFPENKPKGGVPLLITLVSLSMKMDCFVKNESFSHEALKEFLTERLELTVEYEYRNIRKSTVDQLGRNDSGKIYDAITLNAFLGQMESLAREFDVCYRGEFSPFFDLHLLTCSKLYDLFMDDVCNFATRSLQRLDPRAIDLQIVGLCFKLNQLDEDWSHFIRQDQQRWRKPFFHLMFQWTKVLRFHAIGLILEGLEHDQYKCLEIHPSSLLAQDDSNSLRGRSQFVVSHGSAFTLVNQSKQLMYTPPPPRTPSLAVVTPSLVEQNEEFGPLQNRLPPLTLLNPQKLGSRSESALSVSSSGSENVNMIQFTSRSRGSAFASPQPQEAKYSQSFPKTSESVLLKPVALETRSLVNVGLILDESDNESNQSTPRAVSPELERLNCETKEDEIASFRPLQSLPERQQSVWSNPFISMASIPIDDDLHDILKSNEEIRVQVSSTLVDVYILCLRLINASETFAKSVCPISEALKDNEFFKTIGIERLKMRRNLYLALSQGLSKVIQVYANNLVCMDLCGMNAEEASKLIGKFMVDLLRDEFKSSRIWGCRHDLDFKRTNHYRDCSSLDSEDYSSQFDGMLMRINNIYNLSKMIPSISDSCFAAFQAPAMDFQMQANQENDQDFVMIGNSCNKLSADEMFESYESLIQGDCQEHIAKCYRSLQKLLAFRTIEYVNFLMPYLLSDSYLSTIERRLMHLTNYLKMVYENLKIKLYPECFSDFFVELWKQISYSFENIISEMLAMNRTYPGDGAETLLQSISYLVKFMKSLEDTGLELDFLTSTMDDNVFFLSLMTSPTHQLIILYLAMADVDMYSQALGPSQDDTPNRPSIFTPELPCSPEYVLHMAISLHQFRKCFSGRQMINWVCLHPLESEVVREQLEPGERRFAKNLCQRLLDFSVIKVLPYSASRKPSSEGADYGAFAQAYPQVKVVSCDMVSRGFEDTYELDPPVASLKVDPKSVLEKQETEMTKEARECHGDYTPSSPSRSTTESDSSHSALNLDSIQDRDDVFYRFSCHTYEDEELNLLVESETDYRFLSDSDQILDKIRDRYQGQGEGGTSTSVERAAAAGSIKLEKCISKGITLEALLELICERALLGDSLAKRFLRTMGPESKQNAQRALEKLEKNWKARKEVSRKGLFCFLCPQLADQS